MDEVTQQNAALVEEAAAAAESLEEQAQNLMESVSVFKLVEGGTAMGSIKRHTPHVSVPAAAESSARAVKKSSPAKPKASPSSDESWEEF